jgi:hypothetical protein
LEENAVPRVNYLHVQNEPPKEDSGLILWWGYLKENYCTINMNTDFFFYLTYLKVSVNLIYFL